MFISTSVLWSNGAISHIWELKTEIAYNMSQEKRRNIEQRMQKEHDVNRHPILCTQNCVPNRQLCCHS